MNFLKNVASVFVEFDTKPETPSVTSTPTAPTTPVTSAAVPSTVDSEMLSALEATINNRKTPYTALLDASVKLESAIPDENVRIKAAYAVVGNGRTIDAILNAIDVHISDVEGEKLRFNSTTTKQIEEKCTGPRLQAKQLEESNTNITTRIAHLQAEIAKLGETCTEQTNKAVALVQQADLAEAEIRSVQAKFESAVELMKTKLLQKKSTLASIIK